MYERESMFVVCVQCGSVGQRRTLENIFAIHGPCGQEPLEELVVLRTFGFLKKEACFTNRPKTSFV